MPESAKDYHARVAAALPITLFVESRHHADLPDLADPATTDRAAEMGRLLVVVAAAVEALPSVGRAHVCRWGDGSAHLHWWVMGPPCPHPPAARVLSLTAGRIFAAFPRTSGTRTCASSSTGSSTHTGACRWTGGARFGAP